MGIVTGCVYEIVIGKERGCVLLAPFFFFLIYLFYYYYYLQVAHERYRPPFLPLDPLSASLSASPSSSSSFSWGGRNRGGGGGGGIEGLFPPWDVLGITEEQFKKWEELIKNCWDPDPSLRFEFSEIVHFLSPSTPSSSSSSSSSLLSSEEGEFSSSPLVRPREEEREERAKGLYMG